QFPTGVEQVAGTAVRVFPNPTAGIIHVSGTKSNQFIRISDITGSLKGTYSAQDGETTIDLTGYSKGTYLIQYDGKTVKAVRK
ncbi:MAG: T9SS type A sorting domain-containing protein, partial [Dysgonamonadaceae bacterium]|nr:T9SS type A sorting domain-containing protein [Dysgonamonadaceae bacterium]